LKHENLNILRYDAMSLGVWLQTLRRIWVIWKLRDYKPNSSV